MDDSIFRLPEPITVDILSMLPIETILNCMSVCKTFKKILNEPSFAQLHLTQASNSNSNRGFLIQNIDKPSHNFLFFDMINDLGKLSCPWMFDCPFTDFQEFQMSSSILLGSCNGLIFLNYQRPDSMRFCVCNPVLGEFVVLPLSDDKAYSIFLGFCPNTKIYKVIKFSSYLSSVTEIHTVGTNYWREIDYVPPPVHYSTFLDCSFLNGNLPYLSDRREVSGMICSFNFETEQYLYIPPPTHFFIEETRKRISCQVVALLSGLLCVGYILDKSCYEVFVMKNYGVKESWTKEFTIDINFASMSGSKHLFSCLDTIKINKVILLNSGDMVIGYSCFRLLYYSPKKATVIDILHLSQEENERDRFHGCYYTINLVPSLISLKEYMWKNCWSRPKE